MQYYKKGIDNQLILFGYVCKSKKSLKNTKIQNEKTITTIT
jgi:hypothetical protein